MVVRDLGGRKRIPKLTNRKLKLRLVVFVSVMLVLVLLAYFYGASPWTAV